MLSLINRIKRLFWCILPFNIALWINLQLDSLYIIGVKIIRDLKKSKRKRMLEDKADKLIQKLKEEDELEEEDGKDL